MAEQTAGSQSPPFSAGEAGAGGEKGRQKEGKANNSLSLPGQDETGFPRPLLPGLRLLRGGGCRAGHCIRLHEKVSRFFRARGVGRGGGVGRTATGKSSAGQQPPKPPRALPKPPSCMAPSLPLGNLMQAPWGLPSACSLARACYGLRSAFKWRVRPSERTGCPFKGNSAEGRLLLGPGATSSGPSTGRPAALQAWRTLFSPAAFSYPASSRWSRGALSRVRREATLSKADASVPALVHVREVKGEPR